MNTKAMEWAFSTPRSLGGEARVLLLALAYDAKGTQVFPHGAVLSARTGLDVEELAVLVKSLKADEFLRVEMHGEERQLHLAMPAKGVKKPKEPIKRAAAGDIDTAIRLWNEMAARTALGNPAHRLGAVRKVTEAIRDKLSLRLGETSLEIWAEAVLAVEGNAHCRGANVWRADFNYLLQPKGYGKTINGGWPADYQEVTNGGERDGAAGWGDQRQDRLRRTHALFRGDPSGGDHGGGVHPQDRSAPRLAGRGPGKALPGPTPGRTD